MAFVSSKSTCKSYSNSSVYHLQAKITFLFELFHAYISYLKRKDRSVIFGKNFGVPAIVSESDSAPVSRLFDDFLSRATKRKCCALWVRPACVSTGWSASLEQAEASCKEVPRHYCSKRRVESPVLWPSFY